jgi:hypothetical protein
MNMRNEDFNEKQLQELENELRSLGTPYSGEEPDSRYFANFRVRVMERIREEEAAKARPWYENVLGWIEEHVLVTSLSTAALLVAVWASLMMQPLEPAHHHQMAVAPQVAVPQVQQAPVAEQHDVAVAQPVKSEEPKHVAHHERIANVQPDMASMVTVSSAADVGPVSLDELSAPELKSVLSTLETE